MAELVIVFWRDIPAQVKARSGRVTVRKELAPRFAEAIDRAAMVCGATDSGAYLADWRTSSTTEIAGDLRLAVDEACVQLQTEWDEARLSAVVLNGGRECRNA